MMGYTDYLANPVNVIKDVAIAKIVMEIVTIPQPKEGEEQNDKDGFWKSLSADAQDLLARTVTSFEFFEAMRKTHFTL